MGLGGGRKVSKRGIIIIAALLFGIALSSRHVDQDQYRSTTNVPNILALLSKKPTNAQYRKGTTSTGNISRDLKRNAKDPSTHASTFSSVAYVAAEHRSGSLHADETWLAGRVYIIDSEVIVPQGVTLTVAPGAVIKVAAGVSGIRVLDGGSLVARGTDSGLIFITSYRNDTVGGNSDRSSLRAEQGDYASALSIEDGASVLLENIRVSYAEVGVAVSGRLIADHISIDATGVAVASYGGETVLADMTLTDNQTVLQAHAGHVVMRGDIRGYNRQGIRACDWTSSDCSVDASYVHWYDGAPDAQLSDGTATCGRVLVDPGYDGNSLRTGPLSFGRNCDGSAAPDELLRTAALSFDQRIASYDQACSEASQDPCVESTNAYACVASYVDQVAAPFGVSRISTAIPAEDWANSVNSDAHGYLSGQVVPQAQDMASRAALSAVVYLLGVSTNAFSTCAQ